MVDGEVDYKQNFYGYLDPNGTGFREDDGYRYNYAPVNHFLRPNERFTLGTFIDYEINETFRPYLEFFLSCIIEQQVRLLNLVRSIMKRFYLITITLYYLMLKKQQLQGLFSQDGTDQFVAYIGKRNVEGGPRSG